MSSLCACAAAVLSLWGSNAGQLPTPSTSESSVGAPEPDALDRLVEATMAADQLPSLALVVARAGTLLKQAAYGVADLEQRVPATTRTVYPLASATKPA